MKEKLQKHFVERIIITERDGKPNVVTFQESAHIILQDFYKHPKEVIYTNEKLKIIETVARLIKSEVKSVVQTKDAYPSSAEMSSTDVALLFLPESLKHLLKKLVVGSATVVFDCYESGPSTKDMTHSKRVRSG